MLLVFIKQCDEVEFPNAVDATQQLLLLHSTQKLELEQELHRIKTYVVVFVFFCCHSHLFDEWMSLSKKENEEELFLPVIATSAIHHILKYIACADIWSIYCVFDVYICKEREQERTRKREKERKKKTRCTYNNLLSMMFFRLSCQLEEHHV